MSEDGFRAFLKPYIEKQIPFLAYWHPNGMGLIRLDEVMVPRKPPIEAHVLEGNMPTKQHKLTKYGRQKWEKNLSNLRRQTWAPVITVEFDGTQLKTEGGFEL